MSVLKKAYKVLTNCEIAVMSAMFIFLSFAVVADVLGRKFFAVSLSWLEELSRYCFIVCTFLGANIAVSRDDHPRMTAIQVAIGPKWAKVLQILADVICIVVFAYVGFQSLRQTINVANMGTMTTGLKIPLFLIQAVIPVSTFAMVIRYLFSLVEKVRGTGKKGEGAQ